MNLPIKILLGVGGTGVTAASSYGIYEFIRPKNIAEKLSWEGKVVLDTTGDTDKDIWEKLKAKYSEGTNTDKFKEKQTLTDVADLKKHCKDVLEKKLVDEGTEENLKQARFWCIKDSPKLSTASTGQ